MITLRRAHERGHANHGWLDTYHTFSFADYVDPRHMGVSVLRVLNDDTVAPGMGFGTHPHADMEIVSVVLEGALAHRDSMGNSSVIRPGEVQRMSAGTGVRHSEFNPSVEEPVHFFQIWILPDRKGLPPSYEQKAFPEASIRGKLRLVASPDGRDGSVTIHQDASLYQAQVTAGEKLTQLLSAGRKYYLHVARGQVVLNGEAMAAGDGAQLVDEAQLRLESPDSGDVLLFDLP
jgi:redox-sensitive bicupin YhaK (pirin superfamily)